MLRRRVAWAAAYAVGLVLDRQRAVRPVIAERLTCGPHPVGRHTAVTALSQVLFRPRWGASGQSVRLTGKNALLPS